MSAEGGAPVDMYEVNRTDLGPAAAEAVAALPPINREGVVDRRLLVKGRRIERYTEPASRGRLWVATPCCDWRFLLDPRRLEAMAFCPRAECRLVYEAELIDEGGADYIAVFTVAGEGGAVATRGRKNRATAS